MKHIIRRRLVLLATAIALVSTTACGGPRSPGANASSTGSEAASAQATITSAATPGGLPAQIFSPSSFWYQQIPASARLNARSSTYVRDLLADIDATSAGFNTTEYTPPIYSVGSSTKRYNVKHVLCKGVSSDSSWVAGQWQEQFGSVPIPAGASGSSGEDAEIVLYSASTRELWELWHFSSSKSGYSACWGGKIADAGRSSGVMTYPFGVAASGLSLVGGTVRISELLAGHIDHVIAIGINRPRSGVYSWPANRTDGTWHSTSAIPEGLRFRLDPRLNIAAMHLNPVARMVAVAAQKYGFIVRDDTFGPLVVYGENATPYIRATGKNPYARITGASPYSYMVGFPWSHLQAMPLNFGKP